MRRKGRYVAQIVIDIDMDDADRHYASFERMEEALKSGELTENIRNHVCDVTMFRDISKVEVTPMVADLYRWDNGLIDYTLPRVAEQPNKPYKPY